MISGDPDLLAKVSPVGVSLVGANHGPKNFRHGESPASNRTQANDATVIDQRDWLSGGATKGRSGCMRNASPAPSSNRLIEPANGQVQLPVRSIKNPNTTGETIPATPKPKFIMPLADPEYFGAISIGTAQIGATTSSTQKNAAASEIAATLTSWTSITGIRNTNPPSIPATMTLRRAGVRLPVRCRIRSLTTPPRVSPITPARNTPAE